MSNELMPVVQFAQSIPNVGSDLLEKLRSSYEQSFNNVGFVSIRMLKAKKGQFILTEGGIQETLDDGVVGVFLGANQYNHAIWYERSYAIGQEPTAPDLCWMMKDGNNFPKALPDKYRQKISVNGQERWGFQIKRRMAFALMRSNSEGQAYLDLERPVAIDIPSMSLFGKDDQAKNLYRFSGIKVLCDKLSTGGMHVYPYMFLMRIVTDRSVPVDGVFMFAPYMPNNQVAFLDAGTLNAVYNASQSDAVKNILDIREKLTYGNAFGELPFKDDSPAPTPAPTPTPTPTPTPAATKSEDTLLQQAQQILAGQAVQPSESKASLEDTLQNLASALS